MGDKLNSVMSVSIAAKYEREERERQEFWKGRIENVVKKRGQG